EPEHKSLRSHPNPVSKL
ncbi:hypothetical protein M514_28182, partial [Trichuris suis]